LVVGSGPVSDIRSTYLPYLSYAIYLFCTNHPCRVAIDGGVLFLLARVPKSGSLYGSVIKDLAREAIHARMASIDEVRAWDNGVLRPLLNRYLGSSDIRRE
jgi:hypothetical protein